MERKSKEIKIGKIKIGGNNPIAIQSMCNTKTYDAESTIKQILDLEESGCQLIRVAVPDKESVDALKQIKKDINIPLVADIHFDYRLALESLKHCDKIRINPGNIGNKKYVKQILDEAKDRGNAIRIGVNLGSIQKDHAKKYGMTSKAMVESALDHVKFCEENNFNNIVVSLKASDVLTTIQANKMFSEKSNYPLHLGVTEAGTKFQGAIKSSVGIGSLLSQGIGDTIRVSLTDNPLEEIEVCHSILKSLGLRKQGINIISCPTCGRTHGNLIGIAKEIEQQTKGINKNLSVAVMGCEVNGPGEAKHADLGVALSKNNGYIFKQGKVLRSVAMKNIVEEMIKEIKRL